MYKPQISPSSSATAVRLWAEKNASPVSSLSKSSYGNACPSFTTSFQISQRRGKSALQNGLIVMASQVSGVQSIPFFASHASTTAQYSSWNQWEETACSAPWITYFSFGAAQAL